MIKAKNCVCPRCGGSVPNDHNKGQYPGALSRVTDYEICAQCGVDEALRDFNKLPPLGLGDWHINMNKRKSK